MDARDSSSDHKLTIGDDQKIAVVDDGVIPIRSIGPGQSMSASRAVDTVAEKRLVWKFDLRILPTVAVMYLFNALVGFDEFTYSPAKFNAE